MITQLLLDFFFALVDGLVALFPKDAAPGWLSDGSGYLQQLWDAGAGLGVWIPWSLVGTVFAAVLSCMGIGFLIKLVRIVASFFTAGGGSAA